LGLSAVPSPIKIPMKSAIGLAASAAVADALGFTDRAGGVPVRRAEAADPNQDVTATAVAGVGFRLPAVTRGKAATARADLAFEFSGAA
jgi:hypothetical protein